MANQIKQEYVSEIHSQFNKTSNFVLIGLEKITHHKLEDLRAQLRAVSPSKEEQPKFTVVKNSLFNVAFNTFNASKKIIPEDESKKISSGITGQSAVMFLPSDWLSALKVFHTFSKDDEGMGFKVAVIDGKVYVKDALEQLANLPSKEVLVSKIIGALKSSQTRIVYSMEYSMMKLVHILKNAKQN